MTDLFAPRRRDPLIENEGLASLRMQNWMELVTQKINESDGTITPTIIYDALTYNNAMLSKVLRKLNDLEKQQ